MILCMVFVIGCFISSIFLIYLYKSSNVRLNVGLYLGSPRWDFKNAPKLYIVVEMMKIEFVLQL